MDKPNVEVLLNMLRLSQKMQGSKGGQKLVSMIEKRTRVKMVLVSANVYWAALRTFLYGGVMFIETGLLLRRWRWFRSIITV